MYHERFKKQSKHQSGPQVQYHVGSCIAIDGHEWQVVAINTKKGLEISGKRSRPFTWWQVLLLDQYQNEGSLSVTDPAQIDQ